MIIYNLRLAIQLSSVKSIFKEYLRKDRNLVFESNNIFIPSPNHDTNKFLSL